MPWPRLVFRIALLFILAMGLTGLPLARAAGPVYPSHDISPPAPAWRMSGECKVCHGAIWREWEASKHSRAGLRSGGILAGVWEKFGRAMREKHGARVYFCGLCHSPASPDLAAWLKGSREPGAGDVWQEEGVGCHFCHSITGGREEEGTTVYDLAVGKTMLGPWEDARSTSHGSAYSALHTGSGVCGGCHGSLTYNGVAVCASREEPQAAKTGCQTCHMAPIPGPPAAQSARTGHYSHYFPGAHSPAMLARAAGLEIEGRAGREGVAIGVTVINRAPHKLPSTQPLRMVFLELKALDGSGKVLWCNFGKAPLEDPGAVFRKVMAGGDKVGVPTWQADRVASDNRIPPWSRARLEYRLPAGIEPRRLEAFLWYRFVPPPLVQALGLPPDDPLAGNHQLARAELDLAEVGKAGDRK